MRTYVAVTGTLFALLVVAHAVRAFYEPVQLQDPWFIGFTVLAIAVAAWAGRLLAGSRRP
jgi:hypothetical protein